MHAPGLEPEPQLGAWAGHDPLALDLPAPPVGELVRVEITGRQVVGGEPIRRDRLLREAGQALVAEVRLRRHQPRRRRIGELVCDRKHLGVLAEERSDARLRRVVGAFAEVVVAQVAAPVDQVLRRPVLVPERVPGPVVVVERHRVRDSEPAHGAADVARHVLERELGRVHADHDEALVVVRLVPGLHVRQRAQAVDARVRPEVDQHDLAAQLFRRQRLAVDPVREPGELRRRAVVAE